MRPNWTRLVVALAAVALGAACGGDADDATDVPSTTTTTTSPAATAAPTTIDRATATLPPPSGPGDLEAWCSGWLNGGSVDLPTPQEEEAALEANAIEMQRVVPEEIHEAWLLYTGGPSVPEADFRIAARDIERFFIENCDMISVGTPITAAP